MRIVNGAYKEVCRCTFIAITITSTSTRTGITGCFFEGLFNGFRNGIIRASISHVRSEGILVVTLQYNTVLLCIVYASIEDEGSCFIDSNECIVNSLTWSIS